MAVRVFPLLCAAPFPLVLYFSAAIVIIACLWPPVEASPESRVASWKHEKNLVCLRNVNEMTEFLGAPR